MRTAAVVTVGTELVTGLVLDTNAGEIGVALTAGGLDVLERVSVPDELPRVTAAIARATAAYDLVVVTGGLGPTHDDITREAASKALGVPLSRDAEVVEALKARAWRHVEARAEEQVLRQADVLAGARVLPAVVGTAPGQIAETSRGSLVLLPGPPREMRSLLPAALEQLGLTSGAGPVVLSVTGMSESDVQVVTERVLDGAPGIGFTVLAKPGEVRVVLFPRGIERRTVETAAVRVREALGDACYSDTGETLAEAVLREARARGLTVAAAESCTGGMISASLTDVPGSSDVFLGGVVSYSNHLKTSALGVSDEVLRAHGAVSGETAAAMAAGVEVLTGADVCVSVTGIAGPGGGTPEKPVGLVWFGLRSRRASTQGSVNYPGDRTGIRVRATAHALDLVRREILLLGR